MATKKELINEIKSLVTDEAIIKSLNLMNKGELEQTLDYEKKVIAFNNPVEEEMGDDGINDVSESDFERLPPKPIEEVEEKIYPLHVQEYVEHKTPSELSISEQRTFARTGVLPIKKKENRYTRFDDEEVKFGF